MAEEPKTLEGKEGLQGEEKIREASSESMPETIEPRSEKNEQKDESAFHEVLSKVATSAKSGGTSSGDAAAHQSDAQALSQMDAEGQIQKLLDLAESKGVVYAVGVARTLGDYYVLDKTRDELADRLYAELVAKGLIEKT